MCILFIFFIMKLIELVMFLLIFVVVKLFIIIFFKIKVGIIQKLLKKNNNNKCKRFIVVKDNGMNFVEYEYGDYYFFCYVLIYVFGCIQIYVFIKFNMFLGVLRVLILNKLGLFQ